MTLKNTSFESFINGDFKNASIGYNEIKIALLKTDNYFQEELITWEEYAKQHLDWVNQNLNYPTTKDKLRELTLDLFKTYGIKLIE